MSQQIPEDILIKLKKCLALGNDKAAFPQEAETALKIANSIMRQYGLSMADVEMGADGHVKKDSFKEACGYGARDLWPWEKSLGLVVENLLPVKYFTRHMKEILFVGAESDATMAAAFYGILRNELLKLSRSEPTPAFRRSFLTGCVRTLEARSKEIQENNIREQRASREAVENGEVRQREDEGYALVVVKGKDVAEYVAETYKLRATVSRGSSLYAGSFERGVAAGKSVNLSFRGQLTGARS